MLGAQALRTKHRLDQKERENRQKNQKKKASSVSVSDIQQIAEKAASGGGENSKTATNPPRHSASEANVLSLDFNNKVRITERGGSHERSKSPSRQHDGSRSPKIERKSISVSPNSLLVPGSN